MTSSFLEPSAIGAIVVASTWIDIWAVLGWILGHWGLDALPIGEQIARLLYASVLAMLPGAERERRNRGAGFRTHTILAGTSAIVGMVGGYGFTGPAADPTRIAAQFLSGIGFFGTGVFLFRRGRTVGQTTACTLVSCAVLGVCVGVGGYGLGTVATLWIFLLLSRRGWIRRWLGRPTHRVVVELSPEGSHIEVRDSLRALGCDIQFHGWETAGALTVLTVDLGLPPPGLHGAKVKTALRERKGVRGVELEGFAA